MKQKDLDLILDDLLQLGESITQAAVKWALHGSDYQFPKIDIHGEVAGLKASLNSNKHPKVSMSVVRTIFYSPTYLTSSEFEWFVRFFNGKARRLKGHIVVGWNMEAKGMGPYYEALDRVASEFDEWTPPKWLDTWSNLSSIQLIFNVFKKMTGGGVDQLASLEYVKGNQDIGRVGFGCSLFLADYRPNEFIAAVRTGEQSFPRALPFSLERSELGVGGVDHVLVVAALLRCRFIAIQQNSANELSELLNRVLLNPNIGDPRSGGSIKFWGGVKEIARKEYEHWIGELNSEDFGFFFSKDVMGRHDVERVSFWSKYLNVMSRVQVILCSGKMVQLKKKFAGQPDALRALSRAKIYSKTNGFHSAVFYFSGHIFIENHETGASCYHYKSDKFTQIAKMIETGNLKENSDLAPHSKSDDARWKHMNGWQEKFEVNLRGFGIRSK